MITNKEELLRRINQSDTLCIQLLNNRWQAVGITIALISGFWTIMLSKSLDNIKSPEIIYLLFFLGCFFSIVLLGLWRYINHLITEEEAGYKDTIFVCRKLIEDLDANNTGYCDDQLRKKDDAIRNNELKIVNFLEHLKSEFDNDGIKYPKNVELFKKIFYLDDEKKLKVAEKNLYPRKFEKGQRNFDKYVFYLVWLFGIVGGVLLIKLIYLYNNFLPDIFIPYTLIVCIGIFLIYLGMLLYVEWRLDICIFSNFLLRNSSSRRKVFNEAIIEVRTK